MSSGRFTKIVATIGPASESPRLVSELIRHGVDVFRLNASYGTHAEHRARIQTIREVGAELGKHVGILLDLQGPKIRLGKFAGGQVALQTGSKFTITTLPVLGTESLASTTYPYLARDVRPGDRILLADGAVELRALSSDDVSIQCEVITGGSVSDNRGINLPGVAVRSPSMTEKDVSDAELGLAKGVDFLALSFVRTGEDVRRLRRWLKDRNASTPVISKIEKPEAWENLDDILAHSDGIMVARGDLGVETALEKVPAMQKAMIDKARLAGRVTITATQMLESMIRHPAPTRAEVSDVANAVYDGTDALMLSAETAAGRYPVEAVRWMASIAKEADANIRRRGFASLPAASGRDLAGITAEAAYHAARSAQVAALAVFTVSGFSARLVARYRPPVPIFAFTPNPEIARRLALVFAVEPLLAPAFQSTDEMLLFTEQTLMSTGRLRAGDSIVFVAGQPPGASGTANLIKLHRLGSPR
ncbi:MAG: pyruvate kinase [Bryobacteraceae bacterium]